MLTEEELQKIFSWQPYREQWPVDRNKVDDNIDRYFGGLVERMTANTIFECYQEEDGNMGNYIGFICYPYGNKEYDGNAISVCISLCAPIAAYGQIHIRRGADYFGWGFIKAETAGMISDPQLTAIEKEIIHLLTTSHLNIMDAAFASLPLPEAVAADLKGENHNEGNQYIHGIFQKTD
jgi:hypothetical protein